MGVAVLDGLMYAVGGQDGMSCLDIVERFESFYLNNFFCLMHISVPQSFKTVVLKLIVICAH